MPFEMVSDALRTKEINLSIKRRCSIRILRFELLILKDAFLMVIFAFVFVVPRKHANHEFSASLYGRSSFRVINYLSVEVSNMELNPTM
jgi:hypothetical protein